MNRIEAYRQDSCFYADHDLETALWCVFGDNSGFAYSSWASQEQAEDAAHRMPKPQ